MIKKGLSLYFLSKNNAIINIILAAAFKLTPLTAMSTDPKKDIKIIVEAEEMIRPTEVEHEGHTRIYNLYKNTAY
ncbi:hypothetical protein [Clostridium polynesiense]|uniref:hypothetical protein n=1 Tax=Clostridium polynesiense TaxID=1325933 RepID=UPI000A489BA4|nr:hypothetical protein [Clostridium polynesiense]